MRPNLLYAVDDNANDAAARETVSQSLDEQMMRRCLALATESSAQREYPFGAVVARNGEIIAEATNRVARDCDVTRHAEVVAMAEAQRRLGNTDLNGCTLYTNVEPCALCSYAIREARLARVVFALRSPVMGGFSRWNILNDRDLSAAIPHVFLPPPRWCRAFWRRRLTRRCGRPPLWSGLSFAQMVCCWSNRGTSCQKRSNERARQPACCVG